MTENLVDHDELRADLREDTSGACSLFEGWAEEPLWSRPSLEPHEFSVHRPKLAHSARRRYVFLVERDRSFAEKYAARSIDEQKPVPVVSVKSLLQNGAVFVLVFCLISIALWLSAGIPLLNPFFATIVIVAAPFVYWMGHEVGRA